MSVSRRFATALAPAVLAFVLPASAQAIDPGVNYDPGSPAGKEYAIPLVQGRAEGAGTENQRAAANTPFGVGITPPGAGGPGGGSRHGGGRAGSGVRGQSGVGGQSTAAASPAVRHRIAQAENADGTALWTLAFALAVLIPAGLLALVLHTRRLA